MEAIVVGLVAVVGQRVPDENAVNILNHISVFSRTSLDELYFKQGEIAHAMGARDRTVLGKPPPRLASDYRSFRDHHGTYAKYGTLEERLIYTEDGQRLTLVETTTQIEGVLRQRLEDPDRYRALIDAAALALEHGDSDRYLKL